MIKKVIVTMYHSEETGELIKVILEDNKIYLKELEDRNYRIEMYESACIGIEEFNLLLEVIEYLKISNKKDKCKTMEFMDKNDLFVIDYR
jgi:hypothetical protein